VACSSVQKSIKRTSLGANVLVRKHKEFIMWTNCIQTGSDAIKGKKKVFFFPAFAQRKVVLLPWVTPGIIARC